MVKGSVAFVLLVLTLACGAPAAHAALDLPDNCDTSDEAVWTGWIHGERRDTLSDPSRSVTHAYTTSIKIRLREIKEPDRVHIVISDRSAKYGIRYVGCRIRLKVEASEIRTGYNGTCSNNTTSSYIDTDKNGSGEIVYKTSNETVPFGNGTDIAPDGIYELVFAPPGFWSPCKDRFPEVAYRLGNSPLSIGSSRYSGSSSATDEKLAEDYSDPKLRLLSENRTRMTGSYSYTVNQNATSMKVMWDICRAGNQSCSAMPDSSPPAAPKCPPPTTQRALMDKTWSERQAKAHQIEEDFKDLQSADQKMQDNQPAWRAAIPICAIQEIGEKTAEAFLIHYGGERAELTEILGKIVTGDLTFVGQGDWSNLGDALTNITSILNAAVGVGDPKAMEEQIADCKALPENLADGARAFVDAYAEVKSAMPKIQKEVNDIRSLDQKYWDQWHQYHQACVDYAQCMGTPPAECPAPPAEPSGPMPGQE